MAIDFVLETGSGLSTATSYISVADMKQYWENRGYDYTLVLPDPDAFEILLNRASQIVDGQYFYKFKGYRSKTDQALQWPRADVLYPDGWEIATNEIPKEVPDAVCEMAYAINEGTDPQPIQTDLGSVKKVTEKVDVISVSKEFQSIRSHPKIPAVDDVLKPLLGSVGTYGGVGLVRV